MFSSNQFKSKPNQTPKQSNWSKLERFNGEKFPECVKALMTAAGYDTLLSLLEINEEKVTEIETFITAQPEYVKRLKCCSSEYYKNLSTFRFIPGHRSTIQSIPLQIQRMGGIKSIVSTYQRSNNINKTDNDLMSKLIAILNGDTKKSNYRFENGLINEDNIKDFQRGSPTDDFICKCKFACPFCVRVFPLTFKKFWMSSNATKHLKQHLQSQTEK